MQQQAQVHYGDAVGVKLAINTAEITVGMDGQPFGVIIRMPPVVLKELGLMIRQQIFQYEERQGKLPKPDMDVFKGMGISPEDW